MCSRPHRLEHAVGQTHTEQVEQHRLTEEVIHAVDLVLGYQLQQELVEFAGRLLVAPERLLGGERGAGRKVDVAQRLARLAGHRRRHREVQHGTAVDIAENTSEIVGVGRVAPAVHGLFCHPVPRVRPLIGESFANLVPPLIVGQVVPSDADQTHVEIGFETEQLAECGEQQPLGQVTRGAENDQRRHLR